MMHILQSILSAFYVICLIGAVGFMILRYGAFKDNVKWKIIARRSKQGTLASYRWSGVHETVVALAVVFFCIVPIINTLFAYALVRPFLRSSRA
jgi:hypothetical protein